MKKKNNLLPIALTIAGSDSGGGAGIQADLKTFASLGVHGTSAITCLTAQNPRRVTGIRASDTRIVREQIEAVFAELRPNAVKTGMLFSTAIIEAVAESLKEQKPRWLVVDPVMVSTSGSCLLKPSAMRALTSRLLPQASLITPNLEEAQILCGRKLRSLDDLHWAARALQGKFGCAALVKGGHLRDLKYASDVFYDGEQELLLAVPFTRGVSTHGTGCTYSAAITAWLARGVTLTEAVMRAKGYISNAIGNSQRVGKHSVLQHFWDKRPKVGG